MKRTALKRTPMKRARKKTVPKAIRDHWTRVAALGCIVTFATECTIHHVHGGSIRQKFGEQAMPGTSQKQNDWLVIPLAPALHTGEFGIDSGMGSEKGVAAWERRWGDQALYLQQVRDRILKRHGYDIYERAGLKV